jgi:hypothetical protein
MLHLNHINLKPRRSELALDKMHHASAGSENAELALAVLYCWSENVVCGTADGDEIDNHRGVMLKFLVVR